jgi:NDP-sugar pyrophosphorylase family protein
MGKAELIWYYFTMQIVIPMSGMGKRFKEAGYSDPKPLIPIDGRPMIEHVIDLFPKEKKFIFICNDIHAKETNIVNILRARCPESIVKIVPYRGLGPVDAIMQVKDVISDTEPTIVNYCDFFMKWDYNDFKMRVKQGNADGSIICYKGFHPHLLGSDFYAGVKIDKNNWMVEIREKHSFTQNKMDTWQSTGTYYFKSGKIMKKYFQQTIDEEVLVNGEYYVSVVYNLMQRDKLKTLVYPVDYFCQWGTPKDLEEYLYWSNYFRRI